MNTTDTCNHEDCDCPTCDACGAHFAEGEGQTFTARYAVGYDDYDHETVTRCNACLGREEAAGRAAEEAAYARMSNEPFDPEADIPF